MPKSVIYVCSIYCYIQRQMQLVMATKKKMIAASNLLLQYLKHKQGAKEEVKVGLPVGTFDAKFESSSITRESTATPLAWLIRA